MRSTNNLWMRWMAPLGLGGLMLAGCGGGGGSSNPPVSVPDLKAIVAQTRTTTKVPALGVAYITSISVQSELGGVRKAGGSEAVTANDLYLIGSNTKAMTATLAGVLVEENKIRWNSTVSEVFSSFAASIHPKLKAVTLEQLLCHRGGVLPVGGLEDMLQLPPFSGNNREQRLGFARHALGQAPSTPVGTYKYSNGGYAVAGAMLEAAAHDSWEHLIESKVLSRVGARPTYGAPLLAGANQPWGHIEIGDQFHPYDARGGFFLPPSLGPSGSVCLPQGGLANFVQAHLRGVRGQNGVVRSTTFTKLHTPYGNLSNGYASGWFEGTVRGKRVAFHDGSDGTFFAAMLLVPSENRAAVVTTNSGGERAIAAIRSALKAMVGIDPYADLQGEAASEGIQLKRGLSSRSVVDTRTRN